MAFLEKKTGFKNWFLRIESYMFYPILVFFFRQGFIRKEYIEMFFIDHGWKKPNK